MKDEIKEILEKLKENISIVSVEEEQLLLDYITNLQARNKKAIEYCNREIGNIIAYFDYVDTKDLENIRNILQGEDKDDTNSR